jgi:hypothetical protein
MENNTDQDKIIETAISNSHQYKQLVTLHLHHYTLEIAQETYNTIDLMRSNNTKGIIEETLKDKFSSHLIHLKHSLFSTPSTEIKESDIVKKYWKQTRSSYEKYKAHLNAEKEYPNFFTTYDEKDNQFLEEQKIIWDNYNKEKHLINQTINALQSELEALENFAKNSTIFKTK